MVTGQSLSDLAYRFYNNLGANFTIDNLIGNNDETFFISHRGSGDEWPEHTELAYSNSAALNVKAVEISVVRSSDGVLYCHHDLNTLRMTGEDHTFSSTSSSVLDGLTIDDSLWLGPNTPTMAITKLTDAIDAVINRTAIFIEDKQGTNAEALLDLMDSYSNPTNKFVWKCYRDAGAVEASSRGYKVWGYLDDDDPNLAAVSAIVDYLGIATTADDAWTTSVVNEGKPVIVYPVRRRVEVSQFNALGVYGMMCSNIKYITTNDPGPMLTEDDFALGRRPAGDLPFALQTAWQPPWDLTNDAMRLNNQFGQAYMLGSLSPTPGVDYSISFELMFPSAIPGSTQHVSFTFGRETDWSYRFNTASPYGGYHMLLRGSGAFQLYRHDPEMTSGTQLATLSTAAPVIGEWVPFRIDVTASSIVCHRLDTVQQISSNDTNYRGGYLHITKNYDGGEVQFRNVLVAAL